jgi:hypothetical protein
MRVIDQTIEQGRSDASIKLLRQTSGLIMRLCGVSRADDQRHVSLKHKQLPRGMGR